MYSYTKEINEILTGQLRNFDVFFYAQSPLRIITSPWNPKNILEMSLAATFVTWK